jgi:sugar phosphate isomerase/epimerase
VSRFPLGVADPMYRPLGLPVEEVARRARADGFEFLDVTVPCEGVELALPVEERFSPTPTPGHTTAAPRPPVTWDEAVARYRAAPGCRLEPTTFGVMRSVAEVRAFLAEVSALRICLDTGHVAAWGEDPCELVDVADHVQLRQASKGVPQALEGDVDFARLFDRLEAVGYRGGVAIEYFDLPDLGYPLDDPIGYGLALAEQVRPLL